MSSQVVNPHQSSDVQNQDNMNSDIPPSFDDQLKCLLNSEIPEVFQDEDNKFDEQPSTSISTPEFKHFDYSLNSCIDESIATNVTESQHHQHQQNFDDLLKFAIDDTINEDELDIYLNKEDETTTTNNIVYNPSYVDLPTSHSNNTKTIEEAYDKDCLPVLSSEQVDQYLENMNEEHSILEDVLVKKNFPKTFDHKFFIWRPWRTQIHQEKNKSSSPF